MTWQLIAEVSQSITHGTVRISAAGGAAAESRAGQGIDSMRQRGEGRSARWARVTLREGLLVLQNDDSILPKGLRIPWKCPKDPCEKGLIVIIK